MISLRNQFRYLGVCLVFVMMCANANSYAGSTKHGRFLFAAVSAVAVLLSNEPAAAIHSRGITLYETQAFNRGIVEASRLCELPMGSDLACNVGDLAYIQSQTGSLVSLKAVLDPSADVAAAPAPAPEEPLLNSDLIKHLRDTHIQDVNIAASETLETGQRLVQFSERVRGVGQGVGLPGLVGLSVGLGGNAVPIAAGLQLAESSTLIGSLAVRKAGLIGLSVGNRVKKESIIQQEQWAQEDFLKEQGSASGTKNLEAASVSRARSPQAATLDELNEQEFEPVRRACEMAESHGLPCGSYSALDPVLSGPVQPFSSSGSAVESSSSPSQSPAGIIPAVPLDLTSNRASHNLSAPTVAIPVAPVPASAPPDKALEERTKDHVKKDFLINTLEEAEKGYASLAVATDLQIASVTLLVTAQAEAALAIQLAESQPDVAATHAQKAAQLNVASDMVSIGATVANERGFAGLANAAHIDTERQKVERQWSQQDFAKKVKKEAESPTSSPAPGSTPQPDPVDTGFGLGGLPAVSHAGTPQDSVAVGDPVGSSDLTPEENARLDGAFDEVIAPSNSTASAAHLNFSTSAAHPRSLPGYLKFFRWVRDGVLRRN